MAMLMVKLKFYCSLYSTFISSLSPPVRFDEMIQTPVLVLHYRRELLTYNILTFMLQEKEGSVWLVAVVYFLISISLRVVELLYQSCGAEPSASPKHSV